MRFHLAAAVKGGAWLVLAVAAAAASAPARAGADAEVAVFAASSLAEAFRDLAAEFRKRNPGIQVRLTLGASSVLRTQIEQGAPADVFASADESQMAALVRAGLVAEPRVFARNLLILALPAVNPGGIRRLEDLERPGLRLASALPSVPIGAYTREALARLARMPGFPPDFAARVQRNVVSREANVRAVLAKVELSEADAAFVYETDARAARRVRTLALPSAARVTARYPIAVLRSSRAPTRADAFAQLVLSSAGRKILRARGFR